MFYSAKNIPLNMQNFGSVPNMSGTLAGWTQKMIFNVITKEIVNFEVVETTRDVSFDGVWQPMGAQQLQIKQTEQRAWPWFIVHSTTDLELKIDDMIFYRDIGYRVMEVTKYLEYGYMEYHIVTDSSIPKQEEPDGP